MTNTAYIELIFRSPMFHDGTGVCLGDGQMETYLKDMGMTGLVSAWAMARRRPKEYRRKLDAATRHLAMYVAMTLGMYLIVAGNSLHV